MFEADQNGASVLCGEGKSMRRNGGTIVILKCLMDKQIDKQTNKQTTRQAEFD